MFILDELFQSDYKENEKTFSDAIYLMIVLSTCVCKCL